MSYRFFTLKNPIFHVESGELFVEGDNELATTGVIYIPREKFSELLEAMAKAMQAPKEARNSPQVLAV